LLPSHQINKPSKLDRARLRLEQAVETLESAFAATPSLSGQGRDQSLEIDALRKQNARLNEASEAVKHRLDKTIERLRVVVE